MKTAPGGTEAQASAGAHGLPPDQEDDDRAEDSAEKPGRFARLVDVDRLSEERRDQRADHAQHRRQDEAARVQARRHRSRDKTDNEPDDDGADDAHWPSLHIAACKWEALP